MNKENQSLLVEIFRETIDGVGSEEAKPAVGYPTGFLNLDFYNGYISTEKMPDGSMHKYFTLGITDGSYVVFIGFTGTGKTTLVCQIAANIIRQFPKGAIWEDSIEGGLTTQRRMSLSGFTTEEEYNRRYIIRDSSITAENFYDRIKRIYNIKMQHKKELEYDTGHRDLYGNPIMKLEPTIYIIDSLAVLMPEKFIAENNSDIANNTTGANEARIIGNIFKTILPLLKGANIILFGINHVKKKPQMGNMPEKQTVPYLKIGETIPKGSTATYLANNIIRIEKKESLKPDQGFKIQGTISSLQIVKSRSSGYKDEFPLVYDFVNGFDPFLSLFQTLKDKKLVYGAGVSYSLDPEKTFTFSQASLREKINNDDEFREYFLTHCINYLKTLPKEPKNSEFNTKIVDNMLHNKNLFEI